MCLITRERIINMVTIFIIDEQGYPLYTQVMEKRVSFQPTSLERSIIYVHRNNISARV